MNIVLNTPQVSVADNRLARCKHPRLRQALMFHQPESALSGLPPVKPLKRASVPASKRVISGGPSVVAQMYVRVMGFLFGGLNLVSVPR